MDSWLNDDIINIQLAGYTLYGQGRTAASGKTRGGAQCIYVNNSWCTISKEILRFCAPEVEYLMISCRSHYLHRQFSSVFFVAVYIPQQTNAGTKTGLNEMYCPISKQEKAYPDVGDFNAGKLKSVLPNFYQDVICATRGKKTQDHHYSTQRWVQALSHPPFGKSDHNSILLIPAYKQKFKQEVPVTRSIKKLSDEADAQLQEFLLAHWNMFRDSSDGIEEYTTSVIAFINKCIDDVVPTVTVRTYPNQKPWITGNNHTEQKARAAVIKERDSNKEAYKKSRYAL